MRFRFRAALTSGWRTRVDIIGIKVIDHIVIAGGRYRSFSEEGSL